MSQDKIRVLRVIEYSGDRAAVEDHLKKVLYGEKTMTDHSPSRLGTYTIKAATVGAFPEIFESGASIDQFAPREEGE